MLNDNRFLDTFRGHNIQPRPTSFIIDVGYLYIIL